MENLMVTGTNAEVKWVGTETLIKIYSPMLTRRNITTAIKNQRFPYMQIGRKRYFKISDIEKWFEEKKIECMKRDYSTLSKW